LPNVKKLATLARVQSIYRTAIKNTVR